MEYEDGKVIKEKILNNLIQEKIVFTEQVNLNQSKNLKLDLKVNDLENSFSHQSAPISSVGSEVIDVHDTFSVNPDFAREQDYNNFFEKEAEKVAWPFSI